MSWIQDPTGAQVPAGRVVRTLVDWSPGWTAMPATIAVDAGTGTITPPASGNPGTLAISGSATRITFETQQDLDATQFAELNWTLFGVYANVQTSIRPTISIENAAGSIGVGFSQGDGDATASLRIGQSGSPVTVPSQYIWNAAQRTAHRNLTLQVRPPTGEVRVFEDDQVVFELPAQYRSNTLWGAVRCRYLTNTTAASQAMYLNRVLLTAAHS